MTTHLRFNITTPLGQAGATDLRDQIMAALAPLGITVESAGSGLDMNVYLRHQAQPGRHLLHSLAGPADCGTCQGIRDAAIYETERVNCPTHREHTPRGPAECRRCQMLRDNVVWMDLGPDDRLYHPNGPGFIPDR